MFQRILVPLDGSERARCAVPVASRIARATGGTVVLLWVVGLPLESALTLLPSLPSASSQTMIEVEKARAYRYLREIVVSDDLAGVQAELEIHAGPVASTIMDIANLQHIDLIVLCRHGHTSGTRWALGGVAEKVVYETAVPILLLHSDKKPFLFQNKSSLRAIVPLDGSMQAETAIEPAAHLIAALSAPAQGVLSLTQVIKLPSLLPMDIVRDSQRLHYAQQQAMREVNACFTVLIERLGRSIVPALKLVLTSSLLFGGDIAEALLDAMEPYERGEGRLAPAYDLLVMTTHGRGGLQHRIMGSIAGRVLHATNLPMMLVPLSQGNHHMQAYQTRPTDVTVGAGLAPALLPHTPALAIEGTV
ncbi:MAG TPA: universal stress protein [Ktedonobacteraceae bacterium]|nr:universal stress protein [Ktedonobacteraceae bacterium]